MQEQLVSFDVAKLAKEKGFEGECFTCYRSEGRLTLYSKQAHEHYVTTSFTPNPFSDFICLAPTQSLLQSWLFKTHGYHISIGFDSWNMETFSYSINQKGSPELHYDCILEFNSYENCLEDALIYCLKRL